jgi:hypothetical protein
MVSFSLPIPTTLSDAVIVGIALIILWVIVSIPVYFAGKLVTTGKSSFGDAMLATLGGGIVYFIVFYGVDFFLGVLLGPNALILGFILALVAWLAIYRASFDTSWFGALGIVLLAWIVLIALDALLTLAFGVTLPKFYPFKL